MQINRHRSGRGGNEKDSVEAKTECKKEPVKGKIVVIWLIFVLVGIAGYCNMTSLRTQENFAKCAAGASCEVSGIIYDRQETTSGWMVQIRAKKVVVKEANLAFSGQMKIVVYLTTSEKPILGQDVVLSGAAALPEHATNPGGFDAADYYKAKKIFMFLKDASYVETGVKKSELLNTLHGIKERVTSVYDQTFEPKAASVLSAMVLGDKRGLDRDTRNMYQLNGIAHILAISGVKTLKLDIPLVPETRINWAFVPLHIAIIYILKLCLDEEIIPRCRFPCSRGYFTKCIN